MEMKVEYPTFYADMTVAFNQALALENRAERDAKVKELQLHYNAQTWITPVLAEELRRLSPTSADIDTSKNNQRNLSKFKENIAKFCVPGRLFASSTQFSQAMDMVCSKWSCQVSHTNNSIRCHYMQPVSKSKRHPDVSKRRKTRSKLDSDCPFCIRYSLPGFVKSNEDPDWKPRMMYQTRLTTQNLHHTCKLTTESYRNASIKSGTKKSRKGAIKGQTGVTAMNAYNADATLLSILGIDCKKILVVKLGGSSITIHQQQQQGGGVGAAHEAVNDEALEWFSETIRSTISKDFVSTAGCGVGDDDDDDNNGSNKYKRPNNKDRIAANDSDEFVNSEQNPAIIVVHGAAGSLFGLGHHSTAKRYGLEGKNSPPPDGMSLAPELVTGIARTRHR